jgi:3',5'-nucleoside bisphosphate phosphatase
VIDLHLHTTASDGRASPEDLVKVAVRARVRVMAVCDHDTVAALDRVAAACAEAGIECVPGIEITAIREDADVHLLGYFFDHRSPLLAAFLEEQLADRRRRLREMVAKLQAMGLRVDADQILGGHDRLDSNWMGRPLLARALVTAGHVRSPREAFDLYLGETGAAWVPRRAPSPEAVIELIHRVGGIASLAHPGLMGHDEWIPRMAAAGLDAIEAYYIEHSPEMTTHYRVLAGRLGLAMSGGSDYHGDPSHGPARPGSVSLPEPAYAELKQRFEASRGVRDARRAEGAV